MCEMILRGNAVSPGVAAGPVYLYAPQAIHARHEFAGPEDAQAEQRAYATARSRAREQLHSLQQRLGKEEAEKAAIFDAHLDLVDDEVIVEEIEAEILRHGRTAGFAVQSVYGRYAKVMAAMEDETMAQRAADLDDVAQRLLRLLYGLPGQDLSCLPGPVILVADDLLPSDTAAMDRANVLGIAAQKGGATSHSAIMARSWGIPAVLGIPGLLGQVQSGQTAVLDALEGTLNTTPNDAAQHEAQKKLAAWRKDAAEAQRFLNAPASTQDGVRVEIGLNLGNVSAQALAASPATDFVGLLRTEFLYLEASHMPTEEEQYAAYKKVLLEYAPRPVTVRTLDIGGDKTLPYFELPKEENPFLGQRALRLCFAHPQLLRTQFRAALRAAAHGSLWLMLPMVSGIEDFCRAKQMLEQARTELAAQGIGPLGEAKLGVMIETPAMVMMAPEIARRADFASIGTNDLCQYLTAADRMNPAVAPYCRATHPALYRAIAMAVRAFDQAGKPICVCGEMAGDPQAACALVGLGLRKLSMSASQLAKVKRALSRHTAVQLQRLAGEILACEDAGEVLQCMQAALAL